MELYHALKYSKFVRLFGGTSVKCHAEFVFEPCIEGFPYVNDEGFIEYMNRVTDEYGIDYIYPAHDSAQLVLTRSQDRLHARVISSAPQTVEICRSKTKTYEYLSGADYLPKVFSDPAQIRDYPVFVKPAVGQGSVGARRIDSREELQLALSDGTDYAVCEYLPGEEITVDCFTDRHGELRVVMPRSRERIRAGISVRSRELPQDAGISAIAEDINSRFEFSGAWFFQLKKNTAGQYRLMEIAPRIAGTMCVSRNLGVNMPMLTLFDAWGYDVNIIKREGAMLVDRAFISRYENRIAYSNVYVDFDDCLVIKGKVNGMLMMYLYQCRDDGKKLYLLSKHAGDLNESLEQYGISPKLFTEIIHLTRAEDKADYILPDSVFIDDSFAERKAVSDRLHIPVFDIDMVESLLSWFA